MFESSDQLRWKQSLTCGLEHIYKPFVFEVLQAGLAKSRSSPLTCEELAAEVPETLTQMRWFFGPASALCVDQ